MATVVIVVTYNSAATIETCLQGALDSLGPADVVLVYDNASTDDTAGIVRRIQRQIGTRVRIVRSDVNLGFGRAVNAAVAELDDDVEHLLLVNPDLTLTRPAVGALRSAVEGGAAFAGPRIVDGGGRVSASPAPAPNWLYVWGVAARLVLGRGAFTRVVRRLHLDRLPLPSARAHAGRRRYGPGERIPLGTRSYLSGACLALRREAFVAAGGFDSRYFMYSEDADLCVRLARRGYSGVYCPTVTVVHAVGSSGGSAVRDHPQVLDGMLRYLLLHQRPIRFGLGYHVTLTGMGLAAHFCPPPARARCDEARSRMLTRAWHWSSPVGATSGAAGGGAGNDQHCHPMGPQARDPGQKRIGDPRETTQAAGQGWEHRQPAGHDLEPGKERTELGHRHRSDVGIARAADGEVVPQDGASGPQHTGHLPP